MNIVVSKDLRRQAAKEMNEIFGQLLSYEEGSNIKDRKEALSKSYPVFTQLLDGLNGPADECSIVPY